MSELCILQDDVPPFANQVYDYNRIFMQIILGTYYGRADEIRMVN
jgi:hypothetical protein